jgi:hypothetical protein
MVPGYSNGFQQGERMIDTGTSAADNGCIVCHRRFTHRYWAAYTDGTSSGPYCAAHFPREAACRC